MRGWLLIPIVLFLFEACKGKDTIPSGVLSQKKMQDVLWDVMRADKFVADYVLKKDSSLNKVTESLHYYQEIFAIHGITEEQFEKSFSFYKEHPDLFKVMMDSMSQARVIAPTQLAEPSVPVVEPIATPDSVMELPTRSKMDTFIRMQKKKIMPVQ